MHRVSMFVIIVLVGITFLTPGFGATELNWKIIKTLDLEKEPLDTALSPDGKLLFVLTEEGEILVFGSDTRPMHKIHVGVHIDQIDIGPGGRVLVLSSRKDKKIRLLSFSDIHEFNLYGSPFKGDAEAPISVVVFSDFQ